MKFKLLMTAKNSVFTISVILLLLNVFTACGKDDDSVVDKQFANTVWIHRFASETYGVYADALVFFRDGTIKEYGLDSHDKILYEYATYRFSRVDANYISFSENINHILVEENHLTLVYNFYKSAYRPEDLA